MAVAWPNVDHSRRAAEFRLDPTVTALALTTFALGCGEELWQAYLPAYLTALGASGVAVGLFGTSRDLLDSLYQYPGGWLTDRLGRRRALLLLTMCATAGYAVYGLAQNWPTVFVGLLGVMCWKSGAFAATFAIIAESVPAAHRTLAFSLQSVLVRVPRILAAPLGGLAIVAAGLTGGLKWCFGASVVLGLFALATQYWMLPRALPTQDVATTQECRRFGRLIPATMRGLLLADCLVRIGEGLAASFIVLFLLEHREVNPAAYGILFALQQAIALASYVPSAFVAQRIGHRPVIAATMVCFALFPLCVRLAGGVIGLAGAFVIGGLKEFGEPARKSLIVTLAPAEHRAMSVGAYYTVRNLVVVPAGLIGGLLWQRAPHLPLEAACAVGLSGLVVFLLVDAGDTGRTLTLANRR